VQGYLLASHAWLLGVGCAGMQWVNPTSIQNPSRCSAWFFSAWSQYYAWHYLACVLAACSQPDLADNGSLGCPSQQLKMLCS